MDLGVQSMEKSTTFVFVGFSAQNQIDQEKNVVFKPI